MTSSKLHRSHEADEVGTTASPYAGEFQNVLAEWLEGMPDFSQPEPNTFGELEEFRAEAERLLTELQERFPALSGKKIGGVRKLYLYDPESYNSKLEHDVVRRWLSVPETLEFSAEQMAQLASGWYPQSVTPHRFKRRFRDPNLARELHRICLEHGNPADITRCNSLPGIQQLLRMRARKTSNLWTFRGEITFSETGDVVINNKIATVDVTKSGKRRVRGNGVAISIDVLRKVLASYS